MEQSSEIILNDNSPDFDSDGKQSDRQNFNELHFLIRYILNGYGVSLQLQNFTLAVYTFTKPGKSYAITDKRFSTLLGLSSPNYICNVRKQLKQYFNESYESGRRHYQFISIKEYKYKKGEKPQPTQYIFEKEFADLIDDLLLKGRAHPAYEKNWYFAFKEVVSQNKAELLEFGQWAARKQRANRSWEQIQETLLYHFGSHTRKIFEHAENRRIKGELKPIEPEIVLESLVDMVHHVYEQMYLKKTPREIADEFLQEKIEKDIYKLAREYKGRVK